MAQIAVDLRRLDPDRTPGAHAYGVGLADALPKLAPQHRWIILEPGSIAPAPPSRAIVILDGGPPVPVVPSLISIPDLGHLLERRGFGIRAWAKRNWSVSWATRQAACVIVPSHSVEQAAHRYLRVPLSRLAVIPPGLPAWFRRPARAEVERLRKELRLPDRYFLFASSPSPRRDLAMLVRAWAQSRPETGPGPSLVLAGSEPPPGSPSGVIGIGRVPRSTMPALLAGAIALLHPGRHEGSALLAMEAMACGTPAVVAASGALPEAVGSTGVVLDPKAPDAWSGAMVLLANETELRAGLSARCRAAAGAFVFETSARALLPHLPRDGA